MKIKTKLIVAFLVVGLTPFAAIGITTLNKSGNALEYQETQKLTAIREIKKSSIERYFNTIRDQILALAEDRMVVNAMQEFKTAFSGVRGWNGISPEDLTALRAELKDYYAGQFAPEYAIQNDGASVDANALHAALDDEAVTLQYYYIQANANPLGEKHKLDRADDSSTYSQTHETYHPAIRTFLEKFGFYDIFLVDHETGDIVYSVFKELDFATSLLDGPYADTNFAEAFRQARDLPNAGQFAFVDFKQYLPSYDAPASFIAAPIFDGEKKLGVLMFQMPLDTITSVMSERAGMGETGETYLIGPDRLMRSDSYLDPKHHSVVASFRHPEKGKVETEAAEAAIAGQAGAGTVIDYNGNPVLSAYTPVDILGTKWGLLAEIDVAEASAAESAMTKLVLGIGAVGALIIAAFGYFVSRGFSTPIVSMTAAMKELADGDLEAEIPASGRKDEIGDMSAAVQVFKESAIRNTELEVEQTCMKERNEVERRETMNRLADEFDANVGAIVDTVSSASAELDTTAQNMAGIAEETSNQASAVAVATEEAATNVQTVASATEEMSSSVNEINRQVVNASQASKRAVEDVGRTAARMETLAQTADKIGEVVSLISDIAEQTNLLALNATIESARAGEAGRGFAVVAAEVKALANETAKATGSISEHILEIQGATGDAVKSIDDIGSVIKEIEENSTAIAAAMEEQGSTTEEVARNITEVATGTEEVSSNIAGVTQATAEAGAASNQVTAAAGELSKQAELMKEEINKFIGQVRAA